MPKRLLYVKVSRAALADFLAGILPDMGFRATRADANADIRLSLESPVLDAASDGEAWEMAEILVERLGALIQVFAPGYGAGLSIHQLSTQKPGGGWYTSVRLLVTAISPNLDPRLAPLASVGVRLLQLAEQHGDVSEALALVSGGASSWHAIYDVIEFLGGDRLLARQKWATKKQAQQAEICKQTANYYRHRGARKKNSLPKEPPTIEDARTFVLGLLRQWLEEKLAKKSAKAGP